MPSQLAWSFFSLFCICGIVGLVAWRHKRWLAEPERPQLLALDDDSDRDDGNLNDGAGGEGGELGLRRRGGNNNKRDRRRRMNAAERLQAAVAEREAAQDAVAARRDNAAHRLAERESREKAAQRLKDREEDALRQLRAEKKQRGDAEYKDWWASEIAVEEKGELGVAPAEADTDALLRAYLAAVASTHCGDGGSAGSTVTAVGEGANSSASATTANAATTATFPIPVTKVLVLEDVAKAFGVTVERLTAVIEEAMQQKSHTSPSSLASSPSPSSLASLRGIMDERGKFIVLAGDELRQIARFITLRGRVSVAEVAAECNRVINLGEH